MSRNREKKFTRLVFVTKEMRRNVEEELPWSVLAKVISVSVFYAVC